MNRQRIVRAGAVALAVVALWLAAGIAVAQQSYIVTPVEEKTLTQLPAGPLYWRLETFSTLAQAKAAEGATSLSGEVGGRFWLATLGAKGGSTPGATAVAEIGPVPPVHAKRYLLRMNDASGPPSSKTSVHMHPGSESFYVLAGQLGQRTTLGSVTVDAGGSLVGRAPGMPMEVSNTGTTDLRALVLFLVDAEQPFSTPASM